jgi:glycosyltransferase involved in cell wall biosynthesis
MRKLYVCSTRSRSGIARYAESFYRVALRDAGYTHLEPDDVSSEMSRPGTAAGTTWLLELGAHQYRERDAFVALVRSGHGNVDVTLHEPPFLTFPFFHFDGAIANRISRGVDWYLDTLGWQTHYMRKARRVFVLSQRGAEWVRARRGISTVNVMPHVVEASSIWSRGPDEAQQDIVFFGFIGRSKGLEYALRLHAAIRADFPDVGMHVVGQATSPREQVGLDALRRTHADGVEYHGFVNEGDLDAIFARAAHVFLPFAPFRYFCPVSGSVLHGLRRGRIVWTSDVNAVAETIQDGVNGLFFTGRVNDDLETYRALRGEPARRASIAANAIETARRMSRFDYGRLFGREGQGET